MYPAWLWGCMWGCIYTKPFGHFGDTCRSECIMKNKRMNKWTIQDGKSFQGFWCPTSNTAAQWISRVRREGWYDGETWRWRGEIKRKVRGGSILPLNSVACLLGGAAVLHVPLSSLLYLPYIVASPWVTHHRHNMLTCCSRNDKYCNNGPRTGSRSERVPILCFPCGKSRSQNAIKTCIRWWVNCVTLGKLMLKIHLVLRDCPPLPHPSNLNWGNKDPFFFQI